MSKILHEEHKVQKITVLILLISVICYIGGQEGHFKETDILSHQSTLLSLSHTHNVHMHAIDTPVWPILVLELK